MSFIKTFAAIGLSKSGIVSLLSITNQNDVVLLFDYNVKMLDHVFFKNHLQNYNKKVEVMSCAINACWEADVIVISNAYLRNKDLVRQIKMVATGKVVIVLLDQKNDYQKDIDPEAKLALFPFSKVLFIPELEMEHMDILLKDHDHQDTKYGVALSPHFT
ncbi:hypothetical protein RCH18_001947 [Flavobacterium sp. PL11]|jgi:hypothetical protein|uniref:hypothetical protein n=1 Tax=Flavobacterium sp. PL11 TaxID=3071717 RepID=UPI002E008374|nr:hypothetical protein [Flavobacterium sp. PL11]